MPQRTHWYANAIGVVPLHLPTEAVSVEPWLAWPEIDGSFVFFGAEVLELVTVVVAFEATVDDPATFVALTRNRIRFPTSSLWSLYVELVAPEMKVQFPPSAEPPSLGHRTH